MRNSFQALVTPAQNHFCTVIMSVGKHHKINGAVVVRELGKAAILGYVSVIHS